MTSKGKERDYYFDNLRFLLIFLVVLAHIIGALSKIYSLNFLYRYIYLFHMPGMLFISGYFAKKTIDDGKIAKNKLFNFFLLYCIFQVIFTLISHDEFRIYQSQFGLWYLQIIMLYTLLLPMLSRVKPGPMIVISILLGLLVGFDKSADHTGSLQRLLVFLPFYMTGFYVSRKQIERLFNKKSAIIGVLFLVIIALLQFKYLKSFNWSLKLSAGKQAYELLGISNQMGVIARLIWYLISYGMIISVMGIVPRKKMFFSTFGSRTLQVFLLHLPFVVILRKTGFFPYLKTLPHIPVIIFIILFSAAVTILLSLKIFSYPFDYIMNIKFKHLLIEGDKK